MPNNIRIGHSPDPDDAFLFYAMTQGKIPLDGFSVSHQLEGIEELNQRAIKGDLEMTAISLHAYPYCADRYVMLTTGASVGEGYGPIVVAREPLAPEKLRGMKVAIPGKLTTAALLLRLALEDAPPFPAAGSRPPRSQLAVGELDLEGVPFDRIPEAVRAGRVPAGVLIHEGQITYQKMGLKKVLDLGEWWKDRTGLPVPLGVNVVRRDLGEEPVRRLARLFQKSLEFAFAHRPEALAYAQAYGRGLDAGLTDRFVGMYVNRWSLDCRPDGAKAMQRLLDEAAEAKLIPRKVPLDFVEV